MLGEHILNSVGIWVPYFAGPDGSAELYDCRCTSYERRLAGSRVGHLHARHVDLDADRRDAVVVEQRHDGRVSPCSGLRERLYE